MAKRKKAAKSTVAVRKEQAAKRRVVLKAKDGRKEENGRG
jgi:hypothetical protein